MKPKDVCQGVNALIHDNEQQGIGISDGLSVHRVMVHCVSDFPSFLQTKTGSDAHSDFHSLMFLKPVCHIRSESLPGHFSTSPAIFIGFDQP